MEMLILLPITFFRFWYWEAPREIVLFFLSLNSSLNRLLSLRLFLQTFFKPVKNEYRKGLVEISIVFGVLIKGILIIVDVLFLLFLVIVEFCIVVLFLVAPIIPFFLLHSYL